MKKTITLLLTLFTLSPLAAEQTITLAIPSMNCAMCPITVKKSLQQVAGVLAVEVNYQTKLGVVKFDNSKTSEQTLINATTNAGYPSILIGEDNEN